MRVRLADGTVKVYAYPRKPKATPASKLEAGTLGALRELYLSSLAFRALKPSTRTGYIHYLRWWEPFRHYRAEEVGRRQVLSLRDTVAEDRGDAAANVFVRVTGSWFGWMVENEWLEASPTWRIRRIPGGGEFPAWTDEQYEHAIGEFPEHLKRAIMLARHTGQRRGDLIALTWAAYDGAAIQLIQQKGYRGKPSDAELVIPLMPDMRRALDAWKQEARSTNILVTDRGVPWNPTYLSRLVGEAVIAIGLPRGLNMHGLRKLAATTLAHAGCSVHDIMSITGHKTLAMVQHYTKSAEQRRLSKGAVLKLEDYRQNGGSFLLRDILQDDAKDRGKSVG